MVEATRNTGIAGTAGRACGLLSLVAGTISVFRTVINDIDEVKSTLEISLTLFYYCGVVFAATLLRTAVLVGAAKWLLGPVGTVGAVVAFFGSLLWSVIQYGILHDDGAVFDGHFAGSNIFYICVGAIVMLVACATVFQIAKWRRGGTKPDGTG